MKYAATSKWCPEPLETVRGKKGFFPGVSGGSVALLKSLFCTSGLQKTMREVAQFVEIGYRSPGKWCKGQQLRLPRKWEMDKKFVRLKRGKHVPSKETFMYKATETWFSKMYTRITSSLEIFGTEGVGVELERWVLYGLEGKAKMLDDNPNTLGSSREF